MANKTWAGTDGSYSTAGNWSPSGVPTAGDSVFIPAGSGSITSGLNQSAVTLDSFIVEAGYAGTIGSSAGYLQLKITNTTGVFVYSGVGQAYIDLSNSAISPTVRDSYQPADGSRGLYLKGSALVTLNVIDGDVGLAAIFGETSTLTTARIVGRSARLVLGSGVTLTTLYQTAGTNELNCAATTCTLWGGVLRTVGTGAITTVNVNDGDFYSESTGTITTLNAFGGVTDFTTSGASRTVTNYNPRFSASVVYDPNVLTITNNNAPSGPVRIDYSLTN